MVILPGDGNGTNFLEVPLSRTNSSEPFALQAFVHDANGSIVASAQVDWNLSFDFNGSEGNNSRVAELNATSGNFVELSLYSTLRRYHGSIKNIEILSSGSGYAEGDTIKIHSINGYGFEAIVSEVNPSTGAIEDINVAKTALLSSRTILLKSILK